MTLTRLSERLPSLPLVLSGPLLRRTEPTGVTVFLALKEQRTVTLKLYDVGAGGARGALRGQGTRDTVRLGQNLHVVAVTATPTAPLAWGGLFLYDVEFGGAQTLLSNGVLAAANPAAIVCYPGMSLPSFALPPENLNQLRLLHGSCRKANGPGKDLLAMVDELIAGSVTKPLERPHQLFLTGDQIYADDVPDALLTVLTDTGNALLGWTPKIGVRNPPPGSTMDVGVVSDPKTPAVLAPGCRQGFVADEAGFTSSEAKSHLLSIAEFYAQYLFAWSDVLWPSALPEFADVYRAEHAWQWAWKTDEKPEALKKFVAERKQAAQFRESLPAVRRALANVPSYMMFDDHEVTDDWNIFRDWCEKVLGGPLGFHVLQNGLAAYAVFQGWGNTPERFAPSTRGAELLNHLSQLGPDPSSGTRIALRAYIGPPSAERVTQNNAVDHLDGELDWHYTVKGPNYEVILLDTRTWRSFDQGSKRPAAMISSAGYRRQLPLPNEPGYVPPPGADGVTFIVAPGPVIDVDYYEIGKELGSYVGLRHMADVENWRFSIQAYERLFSRAFRRRTRIVLLSGDVHYGFSARMAYWAKRPYEASAPAALRGVAAQACSSALRNGWGPGFSRRGFMRWNALPAPTDYGGWHLTPTLYHATDDFRTPDSTPPVADLEYVSKVSANPDWRYRIEYILADRDRSTTNFVITAPDAWEGPAAQEVFREGVKRYMDFVRNHGAGKEVVGENNLGELKLIWNGQRQELTHTLWWRLTEPQKPFPHSVFRIPLMLEPEPPALPVR